jgi:NADH-quinone oxidoreductase subunit N
VWISYLSRLAPETILVIVAVAVCMGGVFGTSRTLWRWIALGGLAAAATAFLLIPDAGMAWPTIRADAMASFGRGLAMAVGFLLVLAAWRPLDDETTPEYLGCLLWIVVGLMLVSAAGDLVVLFAGLELVSIPTYIMLYIGRRSVSSQESTVKYFFLSILASAMLLYGLSFLYGLGGSTDLGLLRERLAAVGTDVAGGSVETSPLLRLAIALVLAGLGFRIAAVPFHFYVADVFQGTIAANAGLLSVAPKIAGFLGVWRVLVETLPGDQRLAWTVVMVLAVLTMTLGNFLALWQDRLLRLLAYSSIANAGTMLIGVAVAMATRQVGDSQWGGMQGVLLYLVVYSIATIGVFAGLAILAREGGPIERVDELAGLAWTRDRRQRCLAWAIAWFMFSLAGIPPLAGFWGKLAVFAGALSAGGVGENAPGPFVGLAVIGVINSAVAAAYYLRIVAVMFFRAESEPASLRTDARGNWVAVAICSALVLAVGLSPGWWLRAASRPGAGPRAGQTFSAASTLSDSVGETSPLDPSYH